MKKDLEDMETDQLIKQLGIRTVNESELMLLMHPNDETTITDVNIQAIVETLTYNGISDDYIISRVDNPYDNTFDFVQEEKSKMFHLIIES